MRLRELEHIHKSIHRMHTQHITFITDTETHISTGDKHRALIKCNVAHLRPHTRRDFTANITSAPVMRFTISLIDPYAALYCESAHYSIIFVFSSLFPPCNLECTGQKGHSLVLCVFVNWHALDRNTYRLQGTSEAQSALIVHHIYLFAHFWLMLGSSNC